MRAHQIVAIGTSAGGIEALRALVARLPYSFPTPICVVMHTFPQSPSILDRILARAGPLPVVLPHDNERLRPGHIYVAPPDCHLLVEPGRVRVTKGPKENLFRPAIDPLFRSVAQVYGPAAIGVLLTGNLDDGAAGLWAIKHLGGVTIVQDPADALFPEMARNALSHLEVDHVVPLAEVASLLVKLVSQPVAQPESMAVPDHLEVEVSIAKEEQSPLDSGIERIAKPSSYSCPECHSVLMQLTEGGRVRFRCHRGHAYSVESLVAAVGDAIDQSLWHSIHALEEGDRLLHRVAANLGSGTEDGDAARVSEQGDHARRHADAIRKIVLERQSSIAAKP